MTSKSLAVLILLLALPLSVNADDEFAQCDALFAAQPETQEPAKCFFDTGRAENRQEEARTRLRALLAVHPDNPWLALYTGHVDTDRSEELYRKAAQGFAALRESRGQVLAHSNLQRILFDSGRVDEAGAQAELALRVAESSGKPDLVAQGRMVQARYLWAVGKDLERAYLLLRQAEPALFPDGIYSAKRETLNALGNISIDLGRVTEALTYYRRLKDLAISEKDRFAEATAWYGMARAVHDAMAELPNDADRQEVVRLSREALSAAIASGNFDIACRAELLLGNFTEGEEARKHFNACLEYAPNQRSQSYCLNGLARYLSTSKPREAQKTIDQSLELAREAEDYWSMALAWRERMRVSWEADSRENAIEDSNSALNAIEAIRDLQPGSTSQAQVFSSWLEDYYLFSGRLLNPDLGKGGQDPERAFQVTERMRARTLMDALQAARAVPAAGEPLRQRRGIVMERISGIQRRLMNPDLPAGDRAAMSKDLERLEMEEAGLRDQIARTAPALNTGPRRPDFANLSKVRQALDPREALLSFQIAPWEDVRGDFAGGSWLTLVTRSATHVVRLPGRGEIRPAVRMWKGTFERRNGSEAGPAVALYKTLLGKAFDKLPPEIERLIIIPDDVLHQLPFAALRATKESPPLGERYEITLIPSATLWLGWKGRRPETAPNPVLALADPPTPGGLAGIQVASLERSAAVFSSAFRLGALPYARQESEYAVEHMGGGSVRRLGEKAAEAFLKHAPLHEFGVLHFATHAVTDEVNPERSGVLLAPGDPAEDGLLQIREIVDLYLQGRTVVLSACSTNTGTVLRGEGVMSLARAFFQAGAHTVVASLWPLRDDEAALFFDRFYDHLGSGLSVAAALHSAQRDRIAAGAPAAAWAGIVVLGDGDVVPLPGGRKRNPLPWALALGALLLLGAGAAVLLRKRTQRT
jgi:CHAT domain-containing protein/tetratricopeptide (TPR) repeat protein